MTPDWIYRGLIAVKKWKTMFLCFGFENIDRSGHRVTVLN
jgi:hypothetical protein